MDPDDPNDWPQTPWNIDRVSEQERRNSQWEYMRKIREYEQMQQAMGVPPVPSKPTNEQLSNKLVDMIVMRLRLSSSARSKLGFDHIHCQELSDKTVTFIVTKDKAMVLEDDKALFPSDALITQIRLLRNE